MHIRVQVAEPSPSSISVGSVPGVPLLRIQPTSLRRVGVTCVARTAELRVLKQSSLAIRIHRRNQFSRVAIGAVSPTISTPEYSLASSLLTVGLEKIFPLISAVSLSYVSSHRVA